ncbi:hypothetical protein S7711_10617 [Stachybotrys chartarum IBT 7711]|uniref:Uncharacterized protein n=1 Tax=Stachybotrys chartarum (strain CBS 109288 / IBT 7711) TaxID=1280523 RepID=A0A084AZ26_STACB|nr:hypothetical protein S7711_10617 [Stachybotrys chartarum IBT 7711]
MQVKATQGVISQPVSEQADAGPPTVLTAQPQPPPIDVHTEARHRQVNESKPGLLGRVAKIGDGPGRAEWKERRQTVSPRLRALHHASANKVAGSSGLVAVGWNPRVDPKDAL